MEVELSFIYFVSFFLISSFFWFSILDLGLGLSVTTQGHRSHVIIESGRRLWKEWYYTVWYIYVSLKINILSSLQMVDLVFLFHSSFLFSFLFYFSIFLFLEQLGLGWISHTVTSVTTWWCSHKTDHETWENLVEDSRTDDVIQYGHHMLASWTTHGCLG